MSKYIFKDSICINTTAEKVWFFFENLEDNYLDWHKKDHIYLKWIKGKPHTVGSIVKAAEYILGKKVIIKMKCILVKKYQEIRYKTLFPMKIFHPESKYEFLDHKDHIEFIATNIFNIPFLFNTKIKELIKDTERHIKEEGVILKNILERKNI